MDDLAAFIGFLHFGGPRTRKSRKSIRALEMASGKGADSTKSTTFGLLWGSLHFGCPRAGNPGNPQGPWKWLPEKERTLQNRQILGFCGVPSFSAIPEQEIQKIHRALGNGFRKRSALSAVPEAGNPPGPEMTSGKGADSTKSTTFGLLWGSLHFGCPRAGNPQGSWKWLPEKERTVQNRQILGFSGVPSISAVPEAGNPGNPQGPWKWLPEKERTLQNRQILGFCGVPSFSAIPEQEIQKIHRALGNGFRKRSGLYKIDNF